MARHNPCGEDDVGKKGAEDEHYQEYQQSRCFYSYHSIQWQSSPEAHTSALMSVGMALWPTGKVIEEGIIVTLKI